MALSLDSSECQGESSVFQQTLKRARGRGVHGASWAKTIRATGNAGYSYELCSKFFIAAKMRMQEFGVTSSRTKLDK